VAAIALLAGGCGTDELADDADETGEAEAAGELLGGEEPDPDDLDPELLEDLRDAEGTLEEIADDVGADEEEPPEYLLAVIDEQQQDPAEATVGSYADALDAAEAVCEQDRSLAADLVALGWEIAGERGSDTTVMDLLRGLEEAVPEEEAPADCVEVLAELLAVMTSG
jgi:hypothetical protein